MNNIKKILIGLLVVITLLPSAAYADYSWDFEKGAGDWICTPLGFTSASSGGVKGVDISTDPTNSNNKVLLIDGNPGKSTGRIDFTRITGKVEVKFKVLFPNLGTEASDFAEVLTPDGELFTPMLYQKKFIFSKPDGNLVASSSWVETNKWYQFRYVIDTGAMKYSAYVKGGRWSSETRIARDISVNSKVLGGISGFMSTAWTAEVCLDDFSVTRTGNSDVVPSTWMYSNNYIIDESKKTIGNFRYKSNKSVVYDTIELIDGVTATISGSGDYLLGGETLTLKYTSTGETKTYTINVRKNSMTKLYQRVLNDTSGKYPSSFKSAFIIK